MTQPSDSSDDDLIRLHEPSEEPPSRRPRRLWILNAILGVIALALLAAVGPLAWRMVSQGGARLTMPATIGALVRDDSPGAKDTVESVLGGLGAVVRLDTTAGAIYSNPGGRPNQSIILFGGTGRVWSPSKDLDSALTVVADTGDPIKDLSEVDPGPLGGVMKCGLSGVPGGNDGSAMAVCGWADHGSLALALFPDRTPADSAVLMRQLRAATLSR